MPARFETSQPDLNRLQAQLLDSGLQQKDNPAYQVISQLIKAVRRIQELINTDIASTNTVIEDSTFLTDTDESVNLPNSRELIAGAGITFDDSVANEKTINATGLIDRVLETGKTLTIENTFSLLAANYYELQGTAVVELQGDGTLGII